MLLDVLQGAIVPAYFLWHPIDHFAHPLIEKEEDGKWKVGTSCQIIEAFSYDLYQRKYMVNGPMEMWYMRDGQFGGQGMGIRAPITWGMGSWMMSSRIVWESGNEGTGKEGIGDEGGVDGVHLHYEMTVGGKGCLGSVVSWLSRLSGYTAKLEESLR